MNKGTKVPGKKDWKDVMMQRICGKSEFESTETLLNVGAHVCGMISLVFTRDLVIQQRELCYQV